MEEELMFMIRNDLAEMKHNDFPEIEEMEMTLNAEGHYVVTYKYKGKTYLISNDLIGEEA